MIVDDDKVKIENLNRSPIFDTSSIGSNKAEAVAKYCKDSRISVTPITGWWDDFLAVNTRKEFPLRRMAAARK